MYTDAQLLAVELTAAALAVVDEAAHVSPRVGSPLLVPPLHLRNALRARPNGQLAMVRRTVKVLLHVVGLREVHGRDSGRRGSSALRRCSSRISRRLAWC